MLIIIFFATAAAKLIVSIICTQLNLGHLAPCSWEPVVISLNCLLLNSTNETLLFDRFLIMYDLYVFTCIILIFVFHCAHVRMSYVLNSYLITYWLWRAASTTEGRRTPNAELDWRIIKDRTSINAVIDGDICLRRRISQVFTALHGMQTRSSDEKAVSPSVCQTRELWQNGRKICPDYYTIWKIV